MGYSNYSNVAYTSASATFKTKSTDDIFTANKTRTITLDLDPKKFEFRECRDSDNHPNAYPIIVGLDETGSMGQLPELMVKNELGTLMEELLKHNIVDPSILFMAFGDHLSDRHPIQIGQFESDSDALLKWLTGFYLEGLGGGHNMESPSLVWYAAARHTVTDSLQKRNVKGCLFTISDEGCHSHLPGAKLKELFNLPEELDDLSDDQLLQEVQRQYHVFHIHAQEGSYLNDKTIFDYWKEKLPENHFLLLQHHSDVAKLIASTVLLMQGLDLDTIAASINTPAVTEVLVPLAKMQQGLRTGPGPNQGIIVL